MATLVRGSLAISLFSFLLAVGCGGPGETHVVIQSQGGTSTSLGGSGGSTFPTSSGGTGNIPTFPAVGGSGNPSATCGNGILEKEKNEDCDDGNRNPKDGCSKLCQLEVDSSCPTPGQPCVSTAVCGDGKLAATETCDDGDQINDNGCSADCSTVDDRWECRRPGQPCMPICGDGVMVGGEKCDDGNTNDKDGCSSVCLLEPGFDCATPGAACTPTQCGNAIREGDEGCDLGDKNGLI